MTELELLAAELNVNERTLRRAVNEHTLRAKRPSPRRLEMSTAEKRYARSAWPLLASLRAALRTESNVRFALLFGSAARGADDTYSDIDLLVEMREQSLDRVADLSVKLEGLTGKRVDVVPIQSAEEMPSLLADAIVEGRVLVDREGLGNDLRKREPALRRKGGLEEKGRRESALAAIDRMLVA
jgi:predicted nucleotidyltransferase